MKIFSDRYVTVRYLDTNFGEFKIYEGTRRNGNPVIERWNDECEDYLLFDEYEDGYNEVVEYLKTQKVK